MFFDSRQVNQLMQHIHTNRWMAEKHSMPYIFDPPASGHRWTIKQKAPARLFTVRPGPKWGMGVRHSLFPVPALGASGAAGFPTLFSTASGVFGLVAGPSSASPLLNFE